MNNFLISILNKTKTLLNLYFSIDGRMEKYLKLLGKWTLPTGSEISKLGGLPSTISPSDHLPLAADFLITAR